jgi:hypothetical protein
VTAAAADDDADRDGDNSAEGRTLVAAAGDCRDKEEEEDEEDEEDEEGNDGGPC